MKIDGTNIQAGQSLLSDILRLQVGQRVKVEILSLGQNEEGTINLGGTILKAKLQAQVKTGDQFLALVKEVNDSGVTLSKDTLSAAQANNLSKEQIIILLNRGFGMDQQIAKLLAGFKESAKVLSILQALTLAASQNPKLQNLVDMLKQIIPQWADLNAQNYHPLQKYFHHLGLEYERFIADMLKKDGFAPTHEQLGLKALLLKLLAEDDLKPRDRELIKLMLDEITGQQLWAQSGDKRNAYFLLHFLLQAYDQQYNCVLAFEGARKGQKTDINHSHIALQVDTPSLAQIGADIQLFDDKLQLVLLHDHPYLLGPLVELAQDELKANLAGHGIQLEQVALKAFQDFPQFARFISGNYAGVDVKR